MRAYVVEQSPISHFFFASAASAPLWLLIRLYLGWEWLSAGWGKFQNPAWVGDHAGAAMTGFVNGALTKTTGAHPDVQNWYAAFLQTAVLPYTDYWGYAITAGEILVGLALILGFLVGVSAFFGALMNMNFMLAGTVSINPIMLTAAIFLMLAWRVAGHWGLDYYALSIVRRVFRQEHIPV